MIRIDSSFGWIETDDYGYVINKQLDSPCYLDSIKKIDLKDWDDFYEHIKQKPSPKPSEFDILELGFWNEDDTYTPADIEWRNNAYKPLN